MSEQNASTEAANSSEETGTQQEQSEAQVDWQKRAADTQSAYHEGQQELARTRKEADELRQRDELYRTMLTADDAEARREAAEALGFQFEDDEPDDGTADPELARLKREHDELKAWRDEFTQTSQQQAAFDRDVSHIGEGLTALSDELQRKLTKEEVQLLGDAAWQNRDEQGLPNIAAVIEMAKPMLAASSQTTPTRPRAPHVPANGEAATHIAQLDTRTKRADYIAEQVAALDADD